MPSASANRGARFGRDAVLASASWAAWADALGFITEFGRSEDAVARRLGTDRVTQTVAWRRRVGGKFGPTVELPAGCYSDDTQLRLATSRAIRANGTFNVEAFSKVELPVLLSYALGAGLGTTAAAQNLTRRNVRWSSNFFDSGRSHYITGGGNGAAMRIQPHVWAWRGGDQSQLVEDVVVNAVCTHGHPEGILGAVFHALTLLHTLRHRSAPDPGIWMDLLNSLRRVPELVARHETLGSLWLPLWEERARHSFAGACEETIVQAVGLVGEASFDGQRADDTYEEIVGRWGGLKADTRGAGLRCALLAAAAAHLYADDPQAGVQVVANVLGSDTDTIATMTGALLGPVVGAPPPGAVQDSQYIEQEALRLWQISAGEDVPGFAYPDLLKWAPPKAAVDVAGLYEGEPALAGLGSVSVFGEEHPSRGRDDAVWQWLTTAFGQSLLAKRRRDPRPLKATQMPAARRHRQPPTAAEADARTMPSSRQAASRSDTNPEASPGAVDDSHATHEPRSTQGAVAPRRIEDAVEMVVDAAFDPKLAGQLLLAYGAQDDGVWAAAAFAGLIAERARQAQSPAA